MRCYFDVAVVLLATSFTLASPALDAGSEQVEIWPDTEISGAGTSGAQNHESHQNIVEIDAATIQQSQKKNRGFWCFGGSCWRKNNAIPVDQTHQVAIVIPQQEVENALIEMDTYPNLNSLFKGDTRQLKFNYAIIMCTLGNMLTEVTVGTMKHALALTTDGFAAFTALIRDFLAIMNVNLGRNPRAWHMEPMDLIQLDGASGAITGAVLVGLLIKIFLESAVGMIQIEESTGGYAVLFANIAGLGFNIAQFFLAKYQGTTDNTFIDVYQMKDRSTALIKYGAQNVQAESQALRSQIIGIVAEMTGNIPPLISAPLTIAGYYKAAGYVDGTLTMLLSSYLIYMSWDELIKPIVYREGYTYTDHSAFIRFLEFANGKIASCRLDTSDKQWIYASMQNGQTCAYIYGVVDFEGAYKDPSMQPILTLLESEAEKINLKLLYPARDEPSAADIPLISKLDTREPVYRGDDTSEIQRVNYAMFSGTGPIPQIGSGVNRGHTGVQLGHSGRSLSDRPYDFSDYRKTLSGNPRPEGEEFRSFPAAFPRSITMPRERNKPKS